MSNFIPKMFFIAMLVIGFFTQVVKAKAETHINISKSQQMMQVDSDYGSYQWPVSTARRGYYTPTGTFRVQAMEKMHYSRLYDWSPMPSSIFFNGNIAIHGTPHISGLGTPKSHGCVRLHPTNAAVLYGIISKDRSGTTIRVID
jgi:lipoprotein-anchoring transpeptidase ErfK/SrfK